MINKSVIVKYLVTVIAAGVVAFYYCLSKEILLANTAAERFTILADGCTIPGLLLTCLGLLLWVSTTGFLDGIAYGLSMAVRMLVPGALLRESPDYHDFVQSKKEKRVSGYQFIIHVGLLYLGLGILFTVLFFTA